MKLKEWSITLENADIKKHGYKNKDNWTVQYSYTDKNKNFVYYIPHKNGGFVKAITPKNERGEGKIVGIVKRLPAFKKPLTKVKRLKLLLSHALYELKESSLTKDIRKELKISA